MPAGPTTSKERSERVKRGAKELLTLEHFGEALWYWSHKLNLFLYERLKQPRMVKRAVEEDDLWSLGQHPDNAHRPDGLEVPAARKRLAPCRAQRIGEAKKPGISDTAQENTTCRLRRVKLGAAFICSMRAGNVSPRENFYICDTSGVVL